MRSPASVLLDSRFWLLTGIFLLTPKFYLLSPNPSSGIRHQESSIQHSSHLLPQMRVLLFKLAVFTFIQSERNLPNEIHQNAWSLSENSKKYCGWKFWLWPRRPGPRISVPTGRDNRANAGHWQKLRRPEGFYKNSAHLNFQTGSEQHSVKTHVGLLDGREAGIKKEEG